MASPDSAVSKNTLAIAITKHENIGHYVILTKEMRAQKISN